ncbi:hypothetical protein IC235_06025 [Hymenobacter sp. BT664]|uniref:Uncharacterized protein n=1 Tax=Hymenobacter montanus TaxID=2771359 RepID=A0A927BBL5_9BACT|nr:hypothetical protein [Hymenobacter montanus]MBD2767446.1 hypothetical protein [Hymenobacter montanus]
MKSVILTCFIILQAVLCFSQTKSKSYKMPFDNKSGVPYFKDPEIGYSVDGFEVDSKGVLYFLANNYDSKKSNLVAFKGGSRIYSKYYPFNLARLSLCDKGLYSADFLAKAHSLYKFNKDNGLLLARFSINNKYRDNAFIFANCFLIVESIRSEGADIESTYYRYDLSGKLVNKPTNAYGLENSPNLDNPDDSGADFLGYYNDRQVYINYDLDNNLYDVFLFSNGGANRNKYTIGPIKGKPLMRVDEFIKLRNNSIFFLTELKNDALLTEVPIATLVTGNN